MSKDLRVRMTKQIIEDSFFQLLEEFPLNKLTVKKICDESQINRSTFYKYYADTYDLMDKIEKKLLLNMREFFESSSNTYITDTLLIILKNIAENKVIYKTLISTNGDPNFVNKMIIESYSVKKESMKDLIPRISETEKEWIYRFMTYGFTNIIISWIENDMKETVDEVAEFINKLSMLIVEGIIIERN